MNNILNILHNYANIQFVQIVYAGKLQKERVFRKHLYKYEGNVSNGNDARKR